jgi:hypothetical protein
MLCRAHRAALVVAKVDRLARSQAFLSRLLEAGVDVRFCDLPQIEGPMGRSTTRYSRAQPGARSKLRPGPRVTVSIFWPWPRRTPNQKFSATELLRVNFSGGDKSASLAFFSQFMSDCRQAQSGKSRSASVGEAADRRPPAIYLADSRVIAAQRAIATLRERAR